ncbi:BZIP transcription factor [Phytophthora cinnamomi]|uniref:BZIP transcription factor n=1 Tax=Phytophthora cinnamomi TaxID=4785 RepID=UPI003559A794|nr:BZIP transcription factor [Phytophthora cinnamomi]
MASSFLAPPNHYLLSDDVIGGVVQRVSSIRGRFGGDGEYTRPRQTFHQLDTTASIGHKRQLQLESLPEMTSKRTTYSMNSNTTEEWEPQSTRRKVKVSASRRERCRINQARYRLRQRQHEEDLDKSIRQVQEQIQDLETRRQDILRCSPTNESVWVMATEYFRLFRYGFMAPMMVPESPSSKSSFSLLTTTKKQDSLTLKQSNVQLEFLKESMAEEVTDGVVCGAEALMENWRLLSRYHGDVHYQLKRLEQLGEDSLCAVTTTSVTMTENTLRHVYPHLDVEHSTLAAKLLNQRLVMRGTVRFDWDNASGRVVRVESKVDALTPMLKLLGSLENVAAVFEKALMTPEGRFTAADSANGNK